ncbi:fatty acid desaturase [Caballeronia sp. SEWSISQ10-4 2]|uniref:fatty acid desaturase n=1 Tax=Caballeronia sp. SEWSISQ10-4 2 TaxID=2937438 RepID=UPI0026518425|nr:fatty acid desaturase [Caballeronia sp. SEWSISQ10-4 2]MDN7183627.1 fatty acid desaturase [Caballeronia sp. SEWSISQ10-4 2]
MKQPNDFATRYSAHGYGFNVRETYRNLPFQPFWTWVTGKSLNSEPPKAPEETLLKVWQLLLHVSWAYAVLIGGTLLGNRLLHADLPWYAKALLSVPIIVMVMNRQRGMLHTFHYTIHGAGISNRKLARFLCKWMLSVPILHTTWENYMLIHIKDHHSRSTFCTDIDPDQQFMTSHGFYKGMSERRFWFLVVFAPFSPMRIWEHLKFRFDQSFVVATRSERIARIAYWAVLVTLVSVAHLWPAFALYYLFPIFFVTQHSSWLQHVAEHLWFPERPADVSQEVYYASLSWGRFFGRPYPVDDKGLVKLGKLATWTAGTLLVDIPLRVYSFMQDLPSHDFHHRSPKVNFWQIAPERAANEGLPSPFGPMAETWGYVENLLVQRDHLCRGVQDPFGLLEWGRRHKASLDADAAARRAQRVAV